MSSTTGLKDLVASPFLWTSTNHYSFLLKTYGIIMAEVDLMHQVEKIRKQLIAAQNDSEKNKKKIGNLKKKLAELNHKVKPDMVQFVQKLNEQSHDVFGEEEWVHILGNQMWNILKQDEKGNDRYDIDDITDVTAMEKRKNVVYLTKLIRDKIAHIRSYSDDVKRKLPQFFEMEYNSKNIPEYIFSENKYIGYWISKFPKLMPYLWLTYYKYKKELNDFYPKYEIEIGKLRSPLLNLNMFEEELQTSLISDLESGNVFKRFKGQGFSLEFRGFPNLVETLGEKLPLGLHINSKNTISLSVSHLSSNDAHLEVVGSDPGAENIILIFTNKITDPKVWKYCKTRDCRVIVFCDIDNLSDKLVEEAVCKFKSENNDRFELTEFPIFGSELSIEKQDLVFERGQVCISGKDMKIKDIFPGNSKVVGGLSGEVLNKLLKLENVKLFTKYEFPKHTGVYIDRELSVIHVHPEKENVTYGELAKIKHIDICIGLGCEIEMVFGFLEKEYLQIFKNVDHLVDKKDTLKPDCQHIWLTEPEELSEKFMDKCESALCSPKIRYIMNDEKTQTLSMRYGRSHRMEAAAERFSNENEFVENISNGKKMFYCLSNPGMGKSKLLISLRNKLINCFVIFCTFRHFVILLQKIVGTRECTKTDIKNAIMEVLECQNDGEKYILSKWLERKGIAGARLELQLDGLDEVLDENIELALTVFEIVEKDFDSIRLWVTSSKAFKVQRNHFTFFTISPFSFDNKLNYFARSWQSKYVTLTENELKLQAFDFFNKHALKFEQAILLLEITETPLGCSVLAELYEDKTIDLLSGEQLSTTVDMFAALWLKKFAVMYREKEGMTFYNDNRFKSERENYFELFTYLALVHLFPAVSSYFSKPPSMKCFTEKNCHETGIITKLEPVVFVHQTFADFFVAHYIFQVLETGELARLCSNELFYNLLYFGRADENKRFSDLHIHIWTLVDKYLQKVTDLSSLEWLNIHKKCSQYPFFEERKFSTLLKVASDCGMRDLERFLKSVWEPESNTDTSSSSLVPENLFIIRFNAAQQSFTNQLYNLTIYLANKGHYVLAKDLIVNKSKDSDVLDKLALALLRNGGGGIFHCIINGILQPCNITRREDILKNTIDFISFVHGINGNEIERRDSLGRNILLALPLLLTRADLCINSKELFVLKEFLIQKLGADVNQTSCDKESILSLGRFLNCKLDDDAQLEYCKMLTLAKSMHFKHINLKCRTTALTPLQEAVHVFGSKLTKESLELFRDLGANFNEKDMSGNTILHFSIEYCDDIQFITNLVEFGSQICFLNGERLCALCLAKKMGKHVLAIYFHKVLQRTVVDFSIVLRHLTSDNMAICPMYSR